MTSVHLRGRRNPIAARPALCALLTTALSGCAAEGALANAMIIEGDAEGNLVKTGADGLPACDGPNDNAVYYLQATDELVFCTAGTYQSLGSGLCGDSPGADAGTDASEAGSEASLPDAGEVGEADAGDGQAGEPEPEPVAELACTLTRYADGAGALRCEDGSQLAVEAASAQAEVGTEDEGDAGS